MIKEGSIIADESNELYEVIRVKEEAFLCQPLRFPRKPIAFVFTKNQVVEAGLKAN